MIYSRKSCFKEGVARKKNMPEIHIVGFRGDTEIMKNAVQRWILEAVGVNAGNVLWEAIGREATIITHPTSVSEDLRSKPAPFILIESTELYKAQAIEGILRDLDPAPSVRIAAPSVSFTDNSVVTQPCRAEGV